MSASFTMHRELLTRVEAGRRVERGRFRFMCVASGAARARRDRSARAHVRRAGASPASRRPRSGRRARSRSTRPASAARSARSLDSRGAPRRRRRRAVAAGTSRRDPGARPAALRRLRRRPGTRRRVVRRRVVPHGRSRTLRRRRRALHRRPRQGRDQPRRREDRAAARSTRCFARCSQASPTPRRSASRTRASARRSSPRSCPHPGATIDAEALLDARARRARRALGAAPRVDRRRAAAHRQRQAPAREPARRGRVDHEDPVAGGRRRRVDARRRRSSSRSGGLWSGMLCGRARSSAMPTSSCSAATRCAARASSSRCTRVFGVDASRCRRSSRTRAPSRRWRGASSASARAEHRRSGTTAAIPRRAPGEPVPLSHTQARAWFLHRLDPAERRLPRIAAVAHRRRRSTSARCAARWRRSPNARRSCARVTS